MDLQHTHDGIKIIGKVRAILTDAKTGKVVQQTEWNHNIIPNVGLFTIANLFGNISDGVGVTYGAVGYGVNTPAATDTQMSGEIARLLITSATLNGYSIWIDYFFNQAQGNGTLNQVALFGSSSATATTNSGVLFEYANLATTVVKDGTNNMTIQCQITFS